MKKLLLSATALLFALGTSAQNDPVMLAPNWKVGDARTLHIVQKTYEIENDTVTEDSTDELDAQVKVTKSSAKAFTVEMVYENVMLRRLTEMNAALGTAADPWRKLTLRYEVQKADGKSELMNWEEAQKFMVSAFEAIGGAVNEEDAEAGAAIALIFSPIMRMLNDKESVQAMFADQIGWLTGVYGKTMLPKDTLRIVQKEANPFSQNADSVTTTTLMTISSLDLAKQRMVIRTEERVDVSQFLKAMKDMMRGMIDGMVKDEKDKAAAKKKMQEEIDGMDMTMKNQTITTVSTRTSWPVKVVQTSRVTSKAPGEHSVKTETWTIDVKE